MTEKQSTRITTNDEMDIRLDGIEKIEDMLWNYWNALLDPKAGYVEWFYTERKEIVRRLFTEKINLKEV